MEMSPGICVNGAPRGPRLLLRLAAAAVLTLGLGGCALSPAPEPEEKAQAEDEEPAVSEQTRATFRAAVTDLQAKRYERAARRLEPLIDHEPPLPGAQLNLGIAYRHLERFEEAEGALRTAIGQRPDWSKPHVQLGIVLRHQGLFGEAREHYEKALALDSDNATAHVNLGVLCDLYLRDLRCAVDHYERYQALTAEEDQQVKLWIADLNRRMGAE